MRTVVMVMSLFFSQQALAQTSQPEDPKDFVCSTSREAMGLASEIVHEQLDAKGVDLPIGKCEYDIDVLWDACAKSKGAKRKKWCQRLTSYCQEFEKQARIVNKNRQDRYQKEQVEKAERQARAKAEREARSGNLLNSTIDGFLWAAEVKTVDLPPTEIVSSFKCRNWPEPESARTKRQARQWQMGSGFASPMFLPSSPGYAMPQRRGTGNAWSCQKCQDDRNHACRLMDEKAFNYVGSPYPGMCARDCFMECDY